MTIALRKVLTPALVDVDLSTTPWRRIWLSAREGIFALVDVQDHAWLSEHTWNVWHGGVHCRWKVYAKRNVGWDRATIRMHREIRIRADPKSDRFVRTHHVDHINGNGLDNRRANLCWVTAKQNAANRFVRSAIPTLEEIIAGLLATLPAETQALLANIPF
jgi:hypothetical protein